MSATDARIPVAQASATIVELSSANTPDNTRHPRVGSGSGGVGVGAVSLTTSSIAALPTSHGLVVQSAEVASAHPSELEPVAERDRLHLTEREYALFGYRSSAKGFAYVDLGCLIIHAIVVRDGIVLFVLLFACLGPLCGFRSANTLNFPAGAAYAIVCVGKAAAYVWLTSTMPLWGAAFFLLCLYSLLQLFILGEVFKYTHGLAQISDERLEELRDPKFLRQALAQFEFEEVAREASAVDRGAG